MSSKDTLGMFRPRIRTALDFTSQTVSQPTIHDLDGPVLLNFDWLTVDLTTKRSPLET